MIKLKNYATGLPARALSGLRSHLPQTILVVLFLLAAAVLLLRVDIVFRDTETVKAIPPAQSSAPNPMKEHDQLPAVEQFQPVAENSALVLRFDETSGHFAVEDKRTGKTWLSFPDPDDWPHETIGGIWKDHLRSPLMLSTMDFSIYNSQAKVTNWIVEDGIIEDYEAIEGGIKLVYSMPNLQVKIPVQIRIQDDFVETTILNDGVEEGKNGLLWVRLFPFFSAEHSRGQDGYHFIPDGSGALIDFNRQGTAGNLIYKAPIYGADWAFFTGNQTRQKVSMPVFGMKSEEHAYVAVVRDGAEHADIIASPAGAYSQYNWIGTEWRYRSLFRQITNRSRNTGFDKYPEEIRFGHDRQVRYYFLEPEQATYAGMANRYRQVLIEEEGYERLQANGDLPLHLSIIGGAEERGSFSNRYIPMTTSSQAMEIVNSLYGSGVENMRINLIGWQKNGFAEFGQMFPVDSRLGGNEGLSQFVEFAHSLQIPVTYGVNYFLHNGKGGFSERYHAMRDMSGTILNYYDWGNRKMAIVSHAYARTAIENDFAEMKKLKLDGVTFGSGYWYGEGLGQSLISDFNDRYGADRTEAMAIQKQYFEMAKEQFATVTGTSTSGFVNQHVDHIIYLSDDYSYDLFSSKAVPFLQIATHGLLTYMSEYVNERQEYEVQLLRDLEFGAVPGFLITRESTDLLARAFGLSPLSSQYSDWETEAVRHYQIFNEVLGDVQDQFIINHEQLAPQVFATTYENGKRVIVNYGSAPYVSDSLRVEAKSYSVQGGMKR
ncbi:DUF5696 domain-containing protein [Paenibacillus senegalensis]|uniref:DUF5696 domain-containing protein n=1 Tax=Paenibacillus senegalensis TaxID=1465766 RepID=UPI000289BA41|nr:DUF5696 domain-containing protein [Paenibacillus senegalensis]